MTLSPVSPLIPLYLAELVFGLLYAVLIHWLGLKGWLKGQTAWSVVVGDAVTMFIQWMFIREQWNPFVTFGCFAMSGAPMVISYFYRHQLLIERAKHTARAWPTNARHAREDALMELTMAIREIEEAAKQGAVNAGTLLTVSNKLHLAKTILNSV